MSAAAEPSEARRLVDQYVSAGSWPHPNDRPCHDCGHVWFRGERSHHYDVQHVDRLAEDPDDVHVVCVLCHNQRSFERGDDTAATWRKHF